MMMTIRICAQTITNDLVKRIYYNRSSTFALIRGVIWTVVAWPDLRGHYALAVRKGHTVWVTLRIRADVVDLL